MMQHTSKDVEGTLTYVTSTGSLFLKVSQGWKEIQVLTFDSTSLRRHIRSCETNPRAAPPPFLKLEKHSENVDLHHFKEFLDRDADHQQNLITSTLD